MPKTFRLKKSILGIDDQGPNWKYVGMYFFLLLFVVLDNLIKGAYNNVQLLWLCTLVKF